MAIVRMEFANAQKNFLVKAAILKLVLLIVMTKALAAMMVFVYAMKCLLDKAVILKNAFRIVIKMGYAMMGFVNALKDILEILAIIKNFQQLAFWIIKLA